MSVLISFDAVPPSVLAKPSDGNYVVKKGKRVELKCETSGNPIPEIQWTREVCSN
jgi:hypothetical protein